MAGRPTPFGLMAAVSLGTLGQPTRLVVAGALEPWPAGDGERVVLNPTLHEVGDRLHVVDRGLAVRVPGDAGEDWLRRAGVLVRQPAWEQLEAVRPAPGLSLSHGDASELRRAAEVLCAVTPARPPLTIRRFCERFIRRYGDAEIPLLEALDDEVGIGLPVPVPDVEWGERERRMLDVIASGVEEWDIAGEDLGPGRPLPPAFSVQAALLADGPARVYGASGPSGVRLIGRHEAARELLEAQVRAEEALDPEAEFVSVTWWGERGGPVLAVPGLRRAEVSPRDLLVRVVDGRPVLRSRVTGRRVLPRIDSAHDFRGVDDPVYRFLGLVQDPDGEGWIRWYWGPLASSARLPRVRHGNLVLAPAQWRHPCVEELPAWVCVVERGRELPVPREEAAGAALVREFLRPAGAYVHDLIVPFTAPVPVQEPRPAAGGRIVFKPGGEWASVKLFCGPSSADRILLETVAPFVAGRQWFFLRHDDPEWHLRVRVRGDVDLRPLAADPRVWIAEIDTYVRETGRYGDIEAAERCFHADSEAVLGLLDTPHERRHLAIAGVAKLFEDAGATAAFPGLGPSAAGRLRQERPAVEEVIALDLFAGRSARWRDDLAGVDLASLAHLHVNRMLRAGHRLEEPLVYDYLSRHTAARFSPKARTPSKKSSV